VERGRGVKKVAVPSAQAAARDASCRHEGRASKECEDVARNKLRVEEVVDAVGASGTEVFAPPTQIVHR